jgi:hypothetical protein
MMLQKKEKEPTMNLLKNIAKVGITWGKLKIETNSIDEEVDIVLKAALSFQDEPTLEEVLTELLKYKNANRQ